MVLLDHADHHGLLVHSQAARTVTKNSWVGNTGRAEVMLPQPIRFFLFMRYAPHPNLTEGTGNRELLHKEEGNEDVRNVTS
jgi:hypothetical protein